MFCLFEFFQQCCPGSCSSQKGWNNGQHLCWLLSYSSRQKKHTTLALEGKVYCPPWHQQTCQEGRLSSHGCLPWGCRMENGSCYTDTKIYQQPLSPSSTPLDWLDSRAARVWLDSRAPKQFIPTIGDNSIVVLLVGPVPSLPTLPPHGTGCLSTILQATFLLLPWSYYVTFALFLSKVWSLILILGGSISGWIWQFLSPISVLPLKHHPFLAPVLLLPLLLTMKMQCFFGGHQVKCVIKAFVSNHSSASKVLQTPLN